MNVKTLIKQALDAQIQGNKEGFNGALKQVMAAKVQKLVSESWGWKKNKLPSGVTKTGIDSYHFDEVELVDGDLAEVDVTIGDFSAPTQGTYDKRADNPSEYYGDPMEFNLTIDKVQRYDEDGNKLPVLTGAEAQNAVADSEYGYGYMWDTIRTYIENEEPDNEPY